MAIPVPIPSGALTVTDPDTARAEALVAAIVQVIKSGTSGGTAELGTPATIVPAGINPVIDPATGRPKLTSVVLDTPQAQLFYRQFAIAMAMVVPSWIPSPPPSVDSTFTGTCLSTDSVGDLVYVTGASKAVTKADPTDNAKMPIIGCIISKSTATDCVVQTNDLVSSTYTGLTPGKMYFVGTDGRPTSIRPTPSIGNTLLVQPIGFAIDSNLMLITPSTAIVRLQG